MSRLVSKTDNFIEFSCLNSYYDFSIQHVPTNYICWNQTENSIELSDQELLKFALNSPSYDFLNAPEEDIYCLDDGKAL